MKNRKILTILVILGLLALIVSVYAFFTFEKRYQEDKKESTDVTKTLPSSQEQDGSNDSKDEIVTTEPDEEMAAEEGDPSDIEPIEITSEDCDNKCIDLNETEEDFMYCLEICGLADSESSDNCENLTGITKDYCWKAQAVENSDLKLCEKIFDTGIKKTCKNRVTEDIVEP